MVPSDLLKNEKSEFSRAQTLPESTLEQPWFAVQRELSRPQNEAELTVLGRRINGHVTETVHHFLLWINGPSNTKKSNTNPHDP